MYSSAEDFVAYHEARGNDLPGTLDDAAIETALLVASEWLDGVYGPSFIGYKTGGFQQEREWPRSDATVYTKMNTPSMNAGFQSYTFPTDAIPERVKNAANEAAYRQIITPGSLLKDYTPGKYKSVSVEGAVSVEFASFNSGSETQIQIAAIDTLLYPLLDSSSHGRMSALSGPVSRV